MCARIVGSGRRSVGRGRGRGNGGSDGIVRLAMYNGVCVCMVVERCQVESGSRYKF